MNKRPPARSKKRATKSSRSRGASDTALRLPAECTLAEVHDLKSKLAALLKAESPVCLDVSGVRRIDTASLQLLAAFARDRRASQLGVDLRGDSGVFEEGVRLLGLRRLFERSPAAPPA